MKEMIVEQKQDGAETFTLTAFENGAAVSSYIGETLGLNGQTPAPGGKFSISEDALFGVRDLYLAGQSSSAQQKLAGAGLTPEQVQAVDRAYGAPGANFSIALIRNRDDLEAQHLEGMGALIGGDSMWKLCQVAAIQGTRIEFNPIDAPAFQQALKNMLS